MVLELNNYCQGKDGKTRGTDAPSLPHKTKPLLSTQYKEVLRRTICVFDMCLPSCETSHAQTHTEIGSLFEAGHCCLAVAFDLSLS